MSYGPESLNPRLFRNFLTGLALFAPALASAIGLGELQGQAVLGQQLRLQVVLLGADRPLPDSSCFRLVQPDNPSELPWLKQAQLVVRSAPRPVLEITTHTPVREPVLQIALAVGCGQDLSREYTLLASPQMSGAPVLDPVPLDGSRSIVATQPRPPRDPVKLRAERGVASASPARVPRDAPEEARGVPPAFEAGDRLRLTAVDVGDPALSMSASLRELDADSQALEARRQMLRLEFRMLVALHEQAVNQLEAAEKLRMMESSLAELQAKSAEIAGRAAPPPVVAPALAPAAQSVTEPGDSSGFLSDWLFYGVLLGALLGAAGWLYWRRNQSAVESYPEVLPPVEPEFGDSVLGEPALVVDLPMEVDHGPQVAVDLELDVAPDPVRPAVMPAAPSGPVDSLMSISATTLDEHFEANPVMELADIMLSFGRVKGAAQALQEYIDNNPQEALQPWIRLMDVYRMAGMREEFEAVARNLNQNFNVQVQQWSAAPASAVDLDLDAPLDANAVAGPQSVEEMPRIISTILAMWAEGDVVGYLYQLLRDNRGGQRLGFPLPVVEEILFLIELKETVNRMGATESRI